MLPLQQAYEIQRSIQSYLKATFAFNDRAVEAAFDAFIEDERQGMFKGPYISLRLPYVRASAEERAQIPLEIKPDWPPYDHQIKAWQRLSAREGQGPEPTIITTGTGSGKTESFLYPILDYCYQRKGQAGIKAIILYPMNALATDQAKRLAEAIYEDERLKGQVTAGLFIGQGQAHNVKFPSVMGADHVIEDREAILKSPPDILLTNFKMLDYGLMRAHLQKLWKHNRADASMLRFLVLDELHTYDGAQGTDVANLIRRLKLKLAIEPGQLCPVGTSATIGSGADAEVELAGYAAKLFGEHIPETAILTENRVKTEQFFPSLSRGEELRTVLPSLTDLERCQEAMGRSYEDYIQQVKRCWNIPLDADSRQIGAYLLELQMVFDLVDVCASGIQTVPQLITKLNQRNKNFSRQIPEYDEEGQFYPKHALVESLLTLISLAKVGEGKAMPLLNLQVQLWIKELSRLLRIVGPKPRFVWNDTAYQQSEERGLPPYYCRECGASGWLGVKPDNHNKFAQDEREVYSKYFDNHKNLYFINYAEVGCVDEYNPTDTIQEHISTRNLEIRNGESADTIEIVAYRRVKGKRAEHYCPECNSRNTVAVIGTRIATLSSITVSQNLSSDLDDTPEIDRKILAFTNSVQDAAHQAGFVEARNYRFTFRASLQQVINQLEKPVDLPGLSEQFQNYWQSVAHTDADKQEDAYYWRFFPSDYFNLETPDNFRDESGYSPDFRREFAQRMYWQVLEEFGFRAQIGRTLEKSLSSAVGIPRNRLVALYEGIRPWLVNNRLSAVDEASFLQFVSLFFYRFRNRGGLDHAFLQKYRQDDLKLWDLNWSRDGRHFLNPRYGPRSRLPKVLTPERESRGIADSTYAQKSNWYHTYFQKYFPLSNADQINEFYTVLLETAREQGLVNREYAKDLPNYALEPSAWYVHRAARRYVCDTCSTRVTVPESDEHYAGVKCPAYRCMGELAPDQDYAKDKGYYYQVYNRDIAPRIYASEHTGILERKKREYIETDFKDRPRYNSLNVLVATSTLEMGIDIGTLNAAINNSVPPLPANFLQRIGRAGRASGSALVVNFAKAQSHDSYYYEDPYEMMDGAVNTPGCYLEAKEILQRHFFAYLVDSWVSQDPDRNKLPNQIRDLRIQELNLDDPDFFLNRLFGFVQNNLNDLQGAFEEVYEQTIEQQYIQPVFDYLDKGKLRSRLRRVIERLKEEREYLFDRRQDLEREIKARKLAKEDPERQEMDREKINLSRIWKARMETFFLEYLTNVGLLPNYAFPETGVTLDAIILPENSPELLQQGQREEISLVRGAGQAIKELAPDNFFFSQGYKLEVKGLNTADWGDASVSNRQYFCSKCDHIGPLHTNQEACPKCGDPSFAAASNEHWFLKMTSVRSFNQRRDSRLDDKKDERSAELYNLTQHLDFSTAVSKGAYVLKDQAFGFQFLSEVKLRDVNLGSMEAGSANRVKIQGLDVPAQGFVTCQHCGFSTSKPYRYQEDSGRDRMHFGYCRYKNRKYNNEEDDVFRHIFLYRELNTEVLKILIPRTDIDQNVDMKIFLSALQLGLRAYFKGRPSHIRFMEYREYNRLTDRFDQYVVLYDSVPGGTSYLENIFEVEAFNKILKLAYDRLQSCACQHRGEDGCYQCIYTYENQYFQETLSRSRAAELLKKLLDHSGQWKSEDNLGTVLSSGTKEESELEERFVYWLGRLEDYYGEEDQYPRIKTSRAKDYDRTYFKLHIETKKYQLEYHLHQQVRIDTQQGVPYSTRPDVMITCVKVVDKSSGQYRADLEQIPQVAIYLDGYRFHATGDHLRFYGDVEKRNGLAESGRYLPWTLVWDDFDLFFAEEGGSRDYLAQQFHDQVFKDTRRRLGKNFPQQVREVNKTGNNLDRLLFLLMHPLDDGQMRKTWASYLSLFQRKLFQPSYPEADLPMLMDFSKPLDTDQIYIAGKEQLEDGLVLFQGESQTPLFTVRTLVNIKRADVYYKFDYQRLEEEDLPKQAWMYFWSLYNLLRLFPEYQLPTSPTTIDLEEIMAFHEAPYRNLVAELVAQKLLEVDEGFEQNMNTLTDAQGKVLAEAELILHEHKIFFEPFDDRNGRILDKYGYTQATIDDFSIETLKL